MRAYAYTAYTAGGQRRRGTLLAETESHATAQLKARGLFASELTPRPERRGGFFGLVRRRLDADMRAVFTRQMATLLGAGLTAEAALEALSGGANSGALETVAARARAALLDGAPLSQALADSGAGFPGYYVAALGAGEVAGNASAVFEALADHLEAAGADRGQVLTALIYPAFVAAVSLLVSGVLLVNVVPEIVALFEGSGRPLPPLSQAVFAFGNWVRANLAEIGIAAGAALTGIIAFARLPATRPAWQRILLAFPIAGRLLRLGAAAQYLRTLALVLASRQPVPDAVDSAAEVLAFTKHRLEARAVSEAVRAGEPLSTALARLSILPTVAIQLIAAGEASARLGPMAARGAALAETWLGNERRRLVAVLDPILMMLLGTVILVIVLAILLPIFDLQAAIAS